MFSTVLLAGAQHVAPYTTDFYPETDWHALDLNRDKKTWEAIQEESNAIGASFKTADNRNSGIKYTFSSRNTADDWYISPGITLEDGKIYKVKFWGRAYDSSEKYSLFMSRGDTPTDFLDGEELVRIDSNTDNREWQQFISIVPIARTDTYYFAFHCTSEANLWYVWVTGFEVAENLLLPGKPTELSVTPAVDRSLMATLRWTLPTKSSDGAPLDENTEFDSVTVTRDGNVIATLPGDATEFVDTADTGLTVGNHSYGVSVSLDGAQGAEAQVNSEYIGEYLPDNLPSSYDFSSQSVEDMNRRFLSKKEERSTTVSKWSFETATTGNVWQFYPGEGKVMDDMLITPELEVRTPGVYRFHLSMRLGDKYQPNLKLCLHNESSVDDYAEIDYYDKIPSNYTDFYTIANIEVPGVYRLALHADGDSPAKGTFYLRQLEAEKWHLTPLAVSELSVSQLPDGEMSLGLSWRLPKVTNVGTEIESLSKVEVYRNDSLIATIYDNLIPGDLMTFVDTPECSGTMSYKVIPYIGEFASEEQAQTISSPWIGDKTQAIPFISRAFDEVGAGLFEVQNLNNDQSAWCYNKENNRFELAAPETDVAEYQDALLTPPLQMREGYYTVELGLCGGIPDSAVQPELKVAFIPSDSDLLSDSQPEMQRIDMFGVDDMKMQILNFNIAEAGVYRLLILFDGTLTAADYSLSVGSVSITRDAIIPAAAENLNVEPAEDRSLSAKISWQNPTVSNVSGVAPIISEVRLLRNGAQIALFDDAVEPGAVLSFDDNLPEAGLYRYSVEVYSEDGAAAESASVISPWIGVGKNTPYEAGYGADNLFNSGEWLAFGSQRGENRWQLKPEYMQLSAADVQADDWVVSPLISLDEFVEYDVTVESWLGLGNSEAVSWELLYGEAPSVEMMNNSLGRFETPATATAKIDAANFTIKMAASGIYSFGIHADSVGSFRITKFSVAEHVDVPVPNSVSEVSAEGLIRYCGGKLQLSQRMARISVYDLQGRCVLTATDCDTLSLETLTRGFYLVSADVAGTAKPMHCALCLRF
jgi:hypothetical protein